MADSWQQRYPTEREPLFACVYCGIVLHSPAGLEDGSDCLCRDCGSRSGEVEPVKEDDHA